jgi:methylglutaconyl-CoA hydratase
MEYKTINLSKDDDIATITLMRPRVHNAMNEQLMKELTTCFNTLDNDKTIRIIILTGEGKSFCAGADLNWMKSMVSYTKEENIRDSRLLLDLFEMIYNCSKPVIGKINGHAFGGGLGLVAVCDIAIAIPGCKFAFSETKLGIIPSVISTYVLRRIIGINHVRRLFITGERFSSEYAEKIGLIDYVISEDEIDKTVVKYSKILKTSGPNAIKEVKQLLQTYEILTKFKFKEHTVEKIAELRISDEGQEGINAFLEKRKPRWSE